MTDRKARLWEVEKNHGAIAGHIMVRDVETERIVALIPHGDEAEDDARAIAACGYMMRSLQEVVTYLQGLESSVETERVLTAAQTALMVATGRHDL